MIPTVKNVFLLTIGSYSMSSSLNAANLATTTFQVLMTVTSSCQVSVNSDINLGSVSLNTSNPSSKTTLSVTCSKNIPFSIGLSPSALNSGTDDGTGTLSFEQIRNVHNYHQSRTVAMTTVFLYRKMIIPVTIEKPTEKFQHAAISGHLFLPSASYCRH